MGNEIRLDELKVLVIDCQATGPNPEKNHLVEIGWSMIDAKDENPEPKIESFLCRIPEDEQLKRRITRLTGLKTEDLSAGISQEEIWNKVLMDARQVASFNNSQICPSVIHFSSYEEPFLYHMHLQFTPQQSFPFDFICTHKLAKILFPSLPRKSLRAVAGFLGYSVPEMRRAAHHVTANIFIWQRMTGLLKERGIFTTEQFASFLRDSEITIKSGTKTKNSKTPQWQFPMEKKIRKELPDLPGVYRMLRSNGDILYIGKATSLKSRVNSYFYNKKQYRKGGITAEMLSQAVDLNVTVTGSPLEAALLETDEIKRYSPPYNIALRTWEREILFFSRDFKLASTIPGDAFPIGPIPSRRSLVSLGGIAALLKGEQLIHAVDSSKDDETALSVLLGIEPEYRPDIDCFKQGVKLFKERNVFSFEGQDIRFVISELLKFGKELRKQELEMLKMQEQEELNEEEELSPEELESELPEEEMEEWIWTPEHVANALERMVKHGAQLIRRARWFCLLSESCLAWNSSRTPEELKCRLLKIKGGEIIGQENIANGQEIPIPERYTLPFAQRKQHFDLMTYDRMQVLTTEIRRLLSGNNDIDISLKISPYITLINKTLVQLLQWV